jgi:hypothetical protein
VARLLHLRGYSMTIDCCSLAQLSNAMTLEVTRTRSVTIMDTFGGQASFFLSLQSDIASTYSYRILSKVTTLLQEGRSKGLRYLELIPEGYANLLSSIQPVQRPRVRILCISYVR